MSRLVVGRGLEPAVGHRVVRRQVRDDEAATPALARPRRGPGQREAQHRVQVRHERDRRTPAGRADVNSSASVERLGEAEAARLQPRASWPAPAMTGPSASGSAYGHAELDDVGARLGDARAASSSERRAVGVAGHHVGDERRAAGREARAQPARVRPRAPARPRSLIGAEPRLPHDVDVLVAAPGERHDDRRPRARAPRPAAAAARARGSTRWPG